jgi:hypothetical protein
MALRTNPHLARNVVMLAMRHALVDALGGSAAAETELYEQTYYHLGLSDFHAAACDGSPLPLSKLNELFPNWKFEHRVTPEEKADPVFKDCPDETREDLAAAKPVSGSGAGIAVSLGDFYVLAPTPMTLSAGNFEQSDSLRLALVYRDRLSQALIDQELAMTLRSTAAKEDIGRASYELLNAGWGWTAREKSR